jgi:ABC-type Fe3+-hydroxamate transport system substrate-binding protein
MKKLIILLLVLASCSSESKVEINETKSNCKTTVEIQFIDSTLDTLIVNEPAYNITLYSGSNAPCLRGNGGWGINLACYVKSFRILNEECEKISFN